MGEVQTAYASASAINTYPSVTGPTFGGTLGLIYSNLGGLPRTGAITGDNLYRYRYDGHGNLVQVRTAANEQFRAYTRDALGERYWDRSFVTGGTDTAFRPYSDGIRPEVSLEINYTLANGASSWVQQDTDLYVLGPNPDERLIWIEIAPNGVQAVRYPHTDRRGSTIAVSQGGQAVEKYGYGEFGQTAPLTGYPYRYTGQRLDARTGLYNYKAREYAPSIGRFLQPDPLGFVDGPNVYAYVGNSPLNATDPTGRVSCNDGASSCETIGPLPGTEGQTEVKPAAATARSASKGGEQQPAGSSWEEVLPDNGRASIANDDYEGSYWTIRTGPSVRIRATAPGGFSPLGQGVDIWVESFAVDRAGRTMPNACDWNGCATNYGGLVTQYLPIDRVIRSPIQSPSGIYEWRIGSRRRNLHNDGVPISVQVYTRD